jgi:hypothetical protein
MPVQRTAADDNEEEDKKPAAVVKTYTEITQEMKVRTKELCTSNLTMLPSMIWEELVHWANATYDGMWHGLKEHQVLVNIGLLESPFQHTCL